MVPFYFILKENRGKNEIWYFQGLIQHLKYVSREYSSFFKQNKNCFLVLQVIVGFGIPVVLHDSSVTLGTVLKAAYTTPSNVSFFTEHNPYVKITHSRRSIGKPVWEGYNRWDLYKWFTQTADRWDTLLFPIYLFWLPEQPIRPWFIFVTRWGYQGRVCLQKYVCEVAAIPFRINNAEIIDEVLHTFFM